jgi:hypothetical protein
MRGCCENGVFAVRHLHRQCSPADFRDHHAVTAILRPPAVIASESATANPSRTSPASISTLKPCAHHEGFRTAARRAGKEGQCATVLSIELHRVAV